MRLLEMENGKFNCTSQKQTGLRNLKFKGLIQFLNDRNKHLIKLAH